MALVIIANQCMNCGKCASTCPEKAIAQRGKTFVIDPTLCTECRKCQPVCSVGCIRHPNE